MVNPVRPRGGTAAQRAAAMPVLAAREIAVTTDTGEVYVGDGVTAGGRLAGAAAFASRISTTPREIATRGAALANIPDRALQVRSRTTVLGPTGESTSDRTVVFSGLPSVGTFSLGYPCTIRLMSRNNSTGARGLATIPAIVGRETNAAIYLGTLVNHLGNEFGIASGTIQVHLSAPAPGAGEFHGSLLSCRVVNTSAVARQVTVQLEYSDPARSPGGVTCWGDSLTVGGASSYPGTLATLARIVVTNRGVGGEASATIAARADAVPTTVVGSFTIPATATGVACTVSPDIPTAQGGALAVTIGGVAGSLTYNAAGSTFTRTTVGGSVVVPAGEPVVIDTGSAHHGVQVVWTRNDTDPTVSYPNIAAIAARSLSGRTLVLSTLRDSNEIVGTARYTATQAANAYLASTYGDAYLDIQSYLASSQALTDAGLTENAQDTIDIANGVTPSQLRTDQIHLTSAGYVLVGTQVYNKLVALNWIKE